MGRIKTEGGSGGKRGHSNMEHFAPTAEVKRTARKARRHTATEEEFLAYDRLPISDEDERTLEVGEAVEAAIWEAGCWEGIRRDWLKERMDGSVYDFADDFSEGDVGGPGDPIGQERIDYWTVTSNERQRDDDAISYFRDEWGWE
jgi:hypothetical protein